MFKLKKSIFILFLGLSQFSIAQNGAVIDKVIAIVGSNPILKSTLEAQYIQYKARGVPGGTDLKCRVFEEILMQKLLINQAEVDSIMISEKEVESELDRRLKSMLAQFGTEKQMEEYFKKPMYAIRDEFLEILRDQMLTQKMQSKITSDIKITPSEVRRYFNDLPKDSLPMINVEVEIGQIVKYPPVREESKKLAKQKLNEFRERIIKGEKFSTLAALYSEDPLSAKDGGELDFHSRTDFVPEFSAAAFALGKDEISRIVETEFGYHIIQLVEKRGEQANFRHILIKPKITNSDIQKAKLFLDSVATRIRIDTLTFEQAAYLFSDDKDTKLNGGLLINPYTGTSKFEISQLSPAINYVLKNLKLGEISNPFEDADDKDKKMYKIIVLKSKSKPHVANLRDDYDRIQQMALANKQQKTFDEWIKQKQKENYIHIDDAFRECSYNYNGWIK